MEQKPEKIIYKNQADILKKVTKFIKSLLDDNIKEAYLFGSIARKEFGKYTQKYKNHYGSDIDLIVFVKDEKALKNWKYLNTEKGFWKLYRAGKIEINGIIHKVDALVVKRGKEQIAKESDIFKSKFIRLK